MHARFRESRIYTHSTHNQSTNTHVQCTCIHQIEIQLAYEMESFFPLVFLTIIISCVFVYDVYMCPSGTTLMCFSNGQNSVRINDQITIKELYQNNNIYEKRSIRRDGVYEMRFIYIENINFLLKTKRRKKKLK